MGRWARGDELACHGQPAMSGGCLNLAEWKIISDLQRNESNARTYLTCGMHKDSFLRLLKERRKVYDPVIEPFQDATVPPLSTKRKRTPRD